MARGGKREGAGRKPTAVKIALPANKCIATKVLGSVDEVAQWKELLAARDQRIRLEAMKYLTDKRDGKPKQAVEHSGKDGGAIPHAIEVTFVTSDAGQS